MSPLARLIGLGFIALCLLSVILKAFVPLPGILGYAPVNLGIGPASRPVEIVVWYGTEKKLWIEEAARRFESAGTTVGGRPIKVTLVGLGSREIADRVARQDWGNDPPPGVVSPASSLWVEVLRSDWAARNGGAQIVEGATPPLVLTPLVAVAWEERADVLWPQGVTDFWPELHDALANPQGWIGVAQANGFAPGSPEYQKAQAWGLVKFGHTSPLRSNSGAQALILMAYGYHGKTSGLTPADVVDEDFQRWLEEMESAVLDFGESTGTFMTNMVQFGPSKYDLVLSYENLAIENITAAQGRWGQNLRVYYPPATMFSDHPYAILGDPLTTSEQRAAAAQFRDFLLSRPIQELALQYGFRPADPNVSVVTSDPANPFNTYASAGVQVDIALQVETPSGETITTLLDLWRRRIGPYAARFEGTP
jgi:ABC-type Fe3+ transport system substrate-binding protein